jgi:hypothetical protein
MGRILTQGEVAMARQLFGASIDYMLVKVHDGKYVFFQPNSSGMTPRGEIYVAGIYTADFSLASPSLKAFFIHEMAHVWQHQTGILTLGVIGSAIAQMIGRAGDYESAYPYVLSKQKDLIDYNLEQQASILEDYFRITRLRLKAAYLQSCDPNLSGTADRELYEAVLRRFLHDPTYSYHGTCTP